MHRHQISCRTRQRRNLIRGRSMAYRAHFGPHLRPSRRGRMLKQRPLSYSSRHCSEKLPALLCFAYPLPSPSLCNWFPDATHPLPIQVHRLRRSDNTQVQSDCERALVCVGDLRCKRNWGLLVCFEYALLEFISGDNCLASKASKNVILIVRFC